MIDRRQFLRGLGAAATLASTGFLALPQRSLPERVEVPGKLLVDLHAHPSNTYPKDELKEMLSWGVTGLARRNGYSSILTYDQALGFEGAHEIEKDRLASMTYNGSTGYFLNNQEIDANHHVVAVCNSATFPNFLDPRKAIEEIQKAGYLSDLAHLFIENGTKLPRVLRWDEVEALGEAYDMADEVECFSSEAADLGPVSYSKANELARQFIKERGRHKGIAVSDAHWGPRHAKSSGILVDEANFSVEALYNHIRTSNFERYEKLMDGLSGLEHAVILFTKKLTRTL